MAYAFLTFHSSSAAAGSYVNHNLVIIMRTWKNKSDA